MVVEKGVASLGRKRRRKGLPIHGWLAVNKDVGFSSAHVVAKVLRITNAAKGGHGGTLDPFSEGLLPIGLGEATKTMGMVLEGDKSYRCWVRFGAETDSGDLTGKFLFQGRDIPEREAIEVALPRFMGTIMQVPPAHSALHVDGKRAYELVRSGQEVNLPPREVVVHGITLESYDQGMAILAVDCGKGTYMRALARDLGRHLGCGAYLERLSRTRTLGFSLDQAVTLDELAQAVEQDRLQKVLYPLDRVLDDIPVLRLGMEAWRQICHGQAVWMKTDELPEGMVRLQTPEGITGAIGKLTVQTNPQGLRLIHPKRVFQI